MAKLRIVIVDNKLDLFVEQGTYEEAVPAILDIVKKLQAAGIAFESISPIEQHKHDDREVRTDVRRE